MRVRAKTTLSEYTVVEGEGLTQSEIGRLTAEPLVAAGIYEIIEGDQMKLRAKNGNVFEAHDDAAHELLKREDKDYEKTDEPLTSESSKAVKPMGTDDFVAAPKAKVPAKGRKSK